MKILDVRALPGPNVYVDRPVLVALMDLEGLTERESNEFPGFVARLLAALPGLREHHCAKGRPGGFVERLEGGTYFGHVVEHATLELNQAAGAPANFGRTVYAGAPGRYNVIVEYRAEHGTRFLLQTALELVEALLADRQYPLAERVAEARRIIARTELGPSTQAVVDAALRRGVPAIRLNDGSLVQLGYGVHRKFIRATESQLTSAVAADIASDKALTKEMLDRAGVPVPRGAVATTEAEVAAALTDLRPPLAVKPLDGNQGCGVSLNLCTPDEAATAFRAAATISTDVVVEECFAGRDYRVLVVDGKVVAAAERVPAHVVGDGVLTVSQLIERANRDPRRGEGHERPLTRIEVDDAVLTYLKRSGRSLEDVPATGEHVPLRETANLSTGGTARDVTDDIHPDVARMCVRAARVIGLDIAGIDLILPDISAPPPDPDGGAGVIEVNAAPGIRMHQSPSEGKPRDAGAAIVEMLFPPGAPSRIPIVAITGTNGKTTTTRMIGDAFSAAGKVVGMTTTDGVYVGGRRLKKGDMTGFHSARMVLTDPTVEVAVLETARGGIVRRSLGYDWSDVGVLTNVQPDHLGQDGIETVEDILHIKALVAERVREGGTLVLNADDARLAQLADHPRVSRIRREVVYFSLRDDNPVVRRHCAAGGRAYWLCDGWLVEGADGTAQRLARESAIPVTLGGAARFQTANALAAAAACRALGLGRDQVASSLAAFTNDRDNPGRFNVFRVGRGHVVLDYGHNPAAFAAVSETASQWQGRRVTGVFTAPGDREDTLISEAGRAAARGFGRLIIREDGDRRGRRPGEVAELLRRAVHEVRPDAECLTILDECAALRAAVDDMTDEEVVVFFYEDFDAVRKVLQDYGAASAPAVPPLARPGAIPVSREAVGAAGPT